VVSSFQSVSAVLENYDTLVRNMLKKQSMILQETKINHIYKRYYSKKLHAVSFYWIWNFCVMLPWNCLNSTQTWKVQHGSCIDDTKQYTFSNKSL